MRSGGFECRMSLYFTPRSHNRSCRSIASRGSDIQPPQLVLLLSDGHALDFTHQFSARAAGRATGAMPSPLPAALACVKSGGRGVLPPLSKPGAAEGRGGHPAGSEQTRPGSSSAWSLGRASAAGESIRGVGGKLSESGRQPHRALLATRVEAWPGRDLATGNPRYPDARP